MASCSSCAALIAPLTPTPPIICPSSNTGIPPWRGVKNASGSAAMAVRPLLIMSSNTLVGFWKSTAVRAFPIEIFAPAANVPSRRSSAIRLPPASTTATTPPGALFSFAYASAAAITFLAPSSVSDFLSATWACAVPASAIPAIAIVTARTFFAFIVFLSPSGPPADCVLPGQPASAEDELHNRGIKRGLAEQRLGKRAPDLNLGNILDVSRQSDALVVLAVLGLQAIQQVDLALGIHNLPVWVRGIRNLEIVGKGEDILPVDLSVGHCTGVRFHACERL